MPPTFSIITPVYNVAPYLRECLDSVLAQTYTDWEAICVDDGSTDGSGAILDEYAARDSRFRVIHQANAGVSDARNAALDLAQGKWIIFVDSDDFIIPDLLSVLKENILGIDGCAYMPRFVSVDGSEQQTQPRACVTQLFLGDIIEDLLDSSALNRFLYCVWDKAFKRDIVNKLNLRFASDIRLGEDSLFTAQYLSHINSFKILGDCFGYLYRIYSGQTMDRIDVSMRLESIRQIRCLIDQYVETKRRGLSRLIADRFVGLLLDYRHSDVRRIYINALLLEILELRRIASFVFDHSFTWRHRALSFILKIMPIGVVKIVLRSV